MQAELWVVYQRAVRGRNGVVATLRLTCTQREWDAMERARPGQQSLVRAGIANESEAERLARGAAGDAPKPDG
jgi:hypothetical protein